ncbi:hypothetical protein O6H91_03G073700 [Diphasiastrum complanatum]|uniref:Uncharacterized protein n=1 Tax=Diphasiastrum complanatum TaxID=34168 RepID=A0ACC2E7U3_DIPCM|nr:hypothetical protein O6H91_03G073700 [Diphasiastrum complanatum]
MRQNGLGKQQLGQLHDIFSKFDRDDDGSLTELELGSLLRSLGLRPDGAQLEELVDRADLNRNGLVEFSEFVNVFAPDVAAELPYTTEEVLALFNAFDRDGNGYITAVELAHTMARLGRALSATELTGMIMEADTDGDGRISFTEFVDALSSAAAERAFLSPEALL